MLENFKYIQNISENEATILLYSQIGDSIDANGKYVYGILGNSFAHEIQYLQDKCDVINVRINSIGGSVLDGYSIVSAILNSKVTCNTYIDGMSASIAGVIAMAGKKCYMADYGTMMLHNPSGIENVEVLSLVKSTLVTILSNRTKKTAHEVSVMMDSETWLDATMCLDMGLVDEVVSSNKKMKIPKAVNIADMALVYNKIINQKTNKMNKVTELLKLSNEADEATVVSTIETMQVENEALKERLAVIEAKELAEKVLAEKDLKDKSTEMVEKAITEKKIDEDKKEATIEMAINNYDLVANMIAKISNVKDAVKVFNPTNVAKDERADWTIRDWEKKDAEGLTKIKNETPELYNQMFDSFYKK